MNSIFSSSKPLWMAIVNLSEDSFSDGGLYHSKEKALKKCLELVSQGAHILDFGAVATNPKVKLTTPTNHSNEKEFNTLFECISYVKPHLPKNILISVDTFSPSVAYSLAENNCIDIINDIYASRKEESVQGKLMTTAHVAAQFNLGLVLMHLNETPLSSPILPKIKKFLEERVRFCRSLGVREIALDPGIGYGLFGKTFEQVQEILTSLSIRELSSMEEPLLIGVSRKAFLQDLDARLVEPVSRDQLTKQIELKCLEFGAKLIRTHNMSLLSCPDKL